MAQGIAMTTDICRQPGDGFGDHANSNMSSRHPGTAEFRGSSSARFHDTR